MHSQSITSMLQENKSNDNNVKDERKILAKALKFRIKKRYKEVILLLEPVYQKQNEKCKLSILDLLGFSYMETRQYSAAFQVWKMIYLVEKEQVNTTNKSLPKNLDHVGLIIKALTNMIACAKDATLTDHYVKLVLSYIQDYLKVFSNTPEIRLDSFVPY